jgi:hypothetical protein
MPCVALESLEFLRGWSSNSPKQTPIIQKALDKLDDSDRAKASTATARCGGQTIRSAACVCSKAASPLLEVVANVAKEWMTPDNSVRQAGKAPH